MRGIYFVICMTLCILHSNNGQSTHGAKSRRRFTIPSFIELFRNKVGKAPITDQSQSPDGIGTPISIVSSDKGQTEQIGAIEPTLPVDTLVALPSEPTNIKLDNSPGIDSSSLVGIADASVESSLQSGPIDIANVVPANMDTSAGNSMQTSSSSKAGSLGPGSGSSRRPRGRRRKRPKNKQKKPAKNKAEKHPKEGLSDPAPLPGSITKTEAPLDNLNNVGTDNTAFGPPSDVHVDVPLSSSHDIPLQDINLGALGTHLTSVDLNAPGTHSDPINESPGINTGEQPHIHSNPSTNGANPVSIGNDGIILDTVLVDEQPIGTPIRSHQDVPVSSGEPFGSFQDIPLQDINLGELGTLLTSIDLNAPGTHSDPINASPGMNTGEQPHIHSNPSTNSGNPISPGNNGVMLDTVLINEQPVRTPSNVHTDVPVFSGEPFGSFQDIPLQDIGAWGTHLTSVDLNAPGIHSDPINANPGMNTGEQPHIHSNPSTDGANPIPLGNDGIMLDTGLINEQPVGTPSNVHSDVPVSGGQPLGPFHPVPAQDINLGELGTLLQSIDLNLPDKHSDPISGIPTIHDGPVDKANVIANMDVSAGNSLQTTSNSNTGSLGPGSGSSRRQRGKRPKRPKNKRPKRLKNKAEKRHKEGISEPAPLPGSLPKTDAPLDKPNNVGTDNTAFGPPSDVHVGVPLSSSHDIPLQDINLGELGTHLTSVDLNAPGTHSDPIKASPGMNKGEQPHVHSNPSTNSGNPISLGNDGIMLDTVLINEKPIGTPSNVHSDLPVSGGQPLGPFHPVPAQDINLGELGTLLQSTDLNLPDKHSDPISGTPTMHNGPVDNGNVIISNVDTATGNSLQTTSNSNTGSLGHGSGSSRRRQRGKRPKRPKNKRPKRPKNKRQKRPKNKAKKRPKERLSEPAPLPGSIFKTDAPLDKLNNVGTDNTAFGPHSDVHVGVPLSSSHDIPLRDINLGALGTHLTSVDLNAPGTHSDPINATPWVHRDKKPRVHSNPSTNGGNPISTGNDSIFLGKGIINEQPVGTPSHGHVNVPISSGEPFGPVHPVPPQDINLGGFGSVNLNVPGKHSDPISGTPRMNTVKKPHVHSIPTNGAKPISFGGDGTVIDSALTIAHSSDPSRQLSSLHQTDHNVQTAVNQIGNMLTPSKQVSPFASGEANPKKPLGALSDVHVGTADVGIGGSLHVQHGSQNIDIGHSKTRPPVDLNTHGHQSADDTNFGAPGNHMINPVVPGYHRNRGNRGMFGRPEQTFHSPPTLDPQQLLASMLGLPTSASQQNSRGHSSLTNNDNISEVHSTGGQHWDDRRREGRRRGSRRRGGRHWGSRRWGRGRNGRRRWRNNFQNDHLQIETTTPLTTSFTTTPVPRQHRNDINRMRAPNQNIFNQAGQILHSALTGRGSTGSLLNSLVQTAVGAIGARPGGIRGFGHAQYPRTAVHRRPTMRRGVFFG